ncbi:DUF192 domain-containing protein [Geomicrobium sediminis]|uniref:Uncharacterized membrane protein (UPF0127 family) n=1 Tax=Geomicrobium sediminis TaxID=1347788 RepID=A0ABS2PJ67_9BACL|nr:DUF192 domain-containing protein [Geomicrobium sediminis]MBM7635001.1 uncharacterized membrane protein (UPF0127 family) [Geomicrobium sediminis]
MVWIQGSKTVLVDQLMIANGYVSRLKGLLGKNNLGDREGLLLYPCQQVHTWFMRFPIDCVYLEKINNNEYQIKEAFENVAPWKMLPYAKSVYGVLELRSGAVLEYGLQKGQCLYIDPNGRKEGKDGH